MIGLGLGSTFRGEARGFGKVLVDEKERKEKNGARSGPPKKLREREREKGGNKRREKIQ